MTSEHAETSALLRDLGFVAGDRWPSASELNAKLAEVEERGRRAGWAEAIAALRDMPRGAEDGAPLQLIADAVADVSYAGKQVTSGHARYLAFAAKNAVADYLTAAAPTDGSTDGHD